MAYAERTFICPVCLLAFVKRAPEGSEQLCLEHALIKAAQASRAAHLAAEARGQESEGGTDAGPR